ncbi:MAG TPA: MEDS domain-containing protein [Candidatus Saccharimonadales bacterium]|nr:MEDS domain-containing protein [Candidatus Saccharimonadales bacterium]
MADTMGRRVGIPGTGRAHWGEHLCAFFYTKTDLLNLVVPYIKAGLEDNEFCLWITEENMEEEAMDALQRVLPDAPRYVSRKQLEILPASKWYLTAGVFDAGKSFTNWAARGRAAEANGFVGARTTGNPFWLESEEDWHQFLMYEQAVHQAIETQRVISLCTYPAAICSAKDMIGTFASHHAILTYQGDTWQCLDVRRRQATA